MSGRGGFTLLETLVALLLLAGVVTTLLVTFNRHLSLVMDDRESTTATMLARSSLDDPDFMARTETEGDFGADFPGYSWKREQSDTGLVMLKRYQLTVSWQGGKRSLFLVKYGR